VALLITILFLTDGQAGKAVKAGQEVKAGQGVKVGVAAITDSLTRTANRSQDLETLGQMIRVLKVANLLQKSAQGQAKVGVASIQEGVAETAKTQQAHSSGDPLPIYSDYVINVRMSMDRLCFSQ
jgi:hypothetical protein